MRKGLWSPDEDEKLRSCLAQHVNGSWSDIARKSGLDRCGKSCRRRWMNHLRPELKRCRFTPPEIKRVIQLHRTLGNKWSEIANHLEGRTDNDIKNLWNTQIKRNFQKYQKSLDAVDTTYIDDLLNDDSLSSYSFNPLDISNNHLTELVSTTRKRSIISFPFSCVDIKDNDQTTNLSQEGSANHNKSQITSHDHDQQSTIDDSLERLLRKQLFKYDSPSINTHSIEKMDTTSGSYSFQNTDAEIHYNVVLQSLQQALMENVTYGGEPLKLQELRKSTREEVIEKLAIQTSSIDENHATQLISPSSFLRGLDHQHPTTIKHQSTNNINDISAYPCQSKVPMSSMNHASLSSTSLPCLSTESTISLNNSSNTSICHLTRERSQIWSECTSVVNQVGHRDPIVEDQYPIDGMISSNDIIHPTTTSQTQLHCYNGGSFSHTSMMTNKDNYDYLQYHNKSTLLYDNSTNETSFITSGQLGNLLPTNNEYHMMNHMHEWPLESLLGSVWKNTS